MTEVASGGSYQDPGWGPALRALVGRGKEANGLTILRILFITLTSASVLILVVLTFMDKQVGSPAPLHLIGIVALAAAGAAAALRISRGRLDPASPDKALDTYRSRFFLAFATNEAPLLMAFIVVFLVNGLWPYLVAMPIFLLGMAGIAPGKRNMESLDRELMNQGANFSLRAELAARSPVSYR